MLLLLFPSMIARHARASLQWVMGKAWTDVWDGGLMDVSGCRVIGYELSSEGRLYGMLLKYHGRDAVKLQ